MGTKISTVSHSLPFFRFSPENSISLASKASKRCLEKAAMDLSDIGLIISTGVYRYRNTGEPSIASLVQKRIMRSLQTRLKNGGTKTDARSTFSFDLNQGACGWLAGIQIIDGFIQTGDISHGLVCTGDSEPFRGSSVGYRFDSAAAAIILSGSETPGGFSDFITYYYPGHGEEFISSTHFGKVKGKIGKRNILYIEQKGSYLQSCIECASESLKKYINETALTINDIDLLISSQSPDGLISGLRERTGLGQKIVEVPNNRKKEFHTAGPSFALKKSWDDNSFRSSHNILFLTVGSGITVSLALYKNSAADGKVRTNQ
jgi:3-oxoacyl-[acyl-carrier-protein] synthase-3